MKRLLLLLCLAATAAECTCDVEEDVGRSRWEARKLKVAAIFSILTAGVVGICFPVLGKSFPSLGPGSSLFFAVKAFAAVILATGFIHILPDSFENLTSPCLPESPWQDFPFAGFAAMVAAIGTLTIDCLAVGYFKRMSTQKDENSKAGEGKEAGKEEESSGNECREDGMVHTHASHGHAHGPSSFHLETGSSDPIRYRIISQMGIVVHSVIIGISLGASESASTIIPLVAALSFHQLFEGMGLGGCIVQAKFKWKSIVVMALFFSLTTPLGIVIGIGISSSYNENGLNALVVEELLNGAAAGILIYMALVDLLAADFMNPKVQSSGMLQLSVNVSLLLGAGLMSLLAKWA